LQILQQTMALGHERVRHILHNVTPEVAVAITAPGTVTLRAQRWTIHLETGEAAEIPAAIIETGSRQPKTHVIDAAKHIQGGEP
jgi:hypothetical protein